MSKLLFMLFCSLVPLSFQSYGYPSCPYPQIEHGRVRRRTGARLARFSCNPRYELVGNKYATCRFGEWDVPMPVCVRAGCDEVSIENGLTFPSHNGAWVTFYCYPGYRREGTTALYCNGYRWNATTPQCVLDKVSDPHLSCDFESNDLCGWRQDELHDFDWSRINMKTPSAFLNTGPAFDHTFGNGSSGYYMFIESTSRMTNESARLISPIYDGSLAKNGCFSFFYHMYGKSIGGLRVYQIPEGLHQLHANLTWNDKQDYLLFEKWGDLGDFWFRNVSKLHDGGENFQIVIEGIRGSSFTSDIAIDDVEILQDADCAAATLTAVTPPPEISESCAGRCDVYGKSPIISGRGCACSALCVADDNCCPDFLDLCVYGQGSADDDDTTDSRTSDQPLTEKLIRTPSTPRTTTSTTTTSTTSLPTTTTTRRSFSTSRSTRFTTTSTTPMPTTSTTTSTSTTKTTTTTRKPRVTTTAKTAPTTRRTISTSTKPTTTTPRPSRPTSTTRASSTPRTTIFVTTRAPTRVPQNTTSRVQSDAAKSKMEQTMQKEEVLKKKQKNENKKVLSEKTSELARKINSSSGATAGIVSALLLAACCVLAALALRSARGRAALARMRGRASSDPEVRYLTREDD